MARRIASIDEVASVPVELREYVADNASSDFLDEAKDLVYFIAVHHVDIGLHARRCLDYFELDASYLKAARGLESFEESEGTFVLLQCLFDSLGSRVNGYARRVRRANAYHIRDTVKWPGQHAYQRDCSAFGYSERRGAMLLGQAYLARDERGGQVSTSRKGKMCMTHRCESKDRMVVT